MIENRTIGEKYFTLLDAIDEGFCIMELVYDKPGKITGLVFREVNQAFEKQTGLSNVIHKTVDELLPDFEQQWIETFTNVIKTGEPRRLENYVKDTNRWYNIYFSVFGGGKSSQLVAVVFHDITECKRHEQQQEYLLKLSDTLRSVADPVAIEEKISRMAMEYFGTDRCYYCTIKEGNALIRKDAFREDLPSVAGTYPLIHFTLLKKMVDEGRTFVVHDANTSEMPDEALRKFCLQLQAISFIYVPVVKKEKAVGLLCLIQSVPRRWEDMEVQLAVETAERTWAAVERAKVEEVLQESEENYRAIVEQSITGILKVNLSRDIIFSNEQFAKRLGYSIRELTSMTLDDIIAEEDLERDKALFGRLIAEGKAYEIEKRMKRKDGSLVWVNNQIAPLFNNKGQPQAAVDISADVSRQKAMEAQKDEFISIASHELKTPLTSIKAYGQMLEEIFEAGSDAPNYGFIKKMNVQIDRLTDLVYSLLDTTRISGGQLALQPEFFDLNVLITQQVKEMQRMAPKHRIIFRASELSPVFADRDRISQVLSNLISNGIKYSPKGGDIVITAKPKEGQLKVRIRDLGIGISAEKQKDIFERFFRISNEATRSISGIGLGLYIATEIIQKHGGVLGVESKPGMGSTFYFTLPYSDNKTEDNL